MQIICIFYFTNNYTTSLTESSIQCSGTDKLNNVTFNGTTISGICTADQSGAGSTTTKYLSYEHNQTIVTQAILSNFTFPLTANKLYEIRCRLMMNTNITANSPRFTVNITGTITQGIHACETSTSGTAKYQLGYIGNNFGCLSTASIGANLPTPFYYEGMIQEDASASNFTLYFIGETTATQYRVYPGSVCYYTQLN